MSRVITGNSSLFISNLQNPSLRICELLTLQGDTQAWYWTTYDQIITSSLQEYHPFPGQATGGVEQAIDLSVTGLDFILSNSGGAFNELLSSFGLDYARLTIRRIFSDTPDLGAMEIFTGRIGDYSYNRWSISGQARNLYHGAEIQWPYYTYADQCVWRFGSTGCGFDTSSITITGSLQASSGKLEFTAASGSFVQSAYIAGAFDKGKFTFTSGQNSGEVRSIRGSTGDLFALSHALPFDVTSGDTFSVYAGCRKRLEADCHSLYNNSSNALAFPWIPRQELAF